jgi:glyoxylase-like metal-dependent hydrolase (beta-lactamase superfamily II)
VILLRAGNASEWTGPTGNNTYLFRGPPSILIDAGVGRAEHLDAIEHALAGARLDLVLVTHQHVDHVAGVPALRGRWPNVVVRGGPGESLVDGEVFTSGEASSLVAVATPGHSPDHFCFLNPGARDVYCGDLVRLGGTVVIPASRGGDLEEYLASLQRVRDLRPARLFPAHGEVIEDPATVIAGYVAHRDARERQVLSALTEGCGTADAIVTRIYPDISDVLRPAARETVLAHLKKIRRGQAP